MILHSPTAQIEALADSLWKPLFANEAVKPNHGQEVPGANDTGDDGVRNVKAACVGKLVTIAPAKFLPQLQVRACITPWRDIR